MNGFCWGLFWGTLLVNSLWRGASRVRKVAVLLTAGQACSEGAMYHNIDLLYDRMLAFIEPEIDRVISEHGWAK